MYTASAFALAFLALAGPARAQFQPRVSNDLATGERYHIEAAAGLWFPIADLSIASSGGGVLSGIIGTTINAKTMAFDTICMTANGTPIARETSVCEDENPADSG